MHAAFRLVWTVLATVVVASPALAAEEAPSFFDSVTFGDTASESAHGVAWTTLVLHMER
jgi:tryptophan-rich sensory protein